MKGRQVMVIALTVFLIGFVHFALREMDSFYQRIHDAQRMHSLPLLELMYSPLFATARTDSRFVE
jgi:hypothetical protein